MTSLLAVSWAVCSSSVDPGDGHPLDSRVASRRAQAVDSVGWWRHGSVDPGDGHPLVVGGERVQRVHEARVRAVRVVVGEHQVDVLLVLALDAGAVL